MSQTVLAEMPCQPGKGAEFLEILLPALADTRAYEGFEEIATFTDQDNPDLVILWEKWASRAHHEAYLAWRIETGMLDLVGAFLTGPPRFAYLSAAD